MGSSESASNYSKRRNIAKSYDIPELICGEFICTLCDAHMNSEAMWNAHVTGKRHIKNVKKEITGAFEFPESSTVVKRKEEKLSSVQGSKDTNFEKAALKRRRESDSSEKTPKDRESVSSPKRQRMKQAKPVENKLKKKASVNNKERPDNHRTTTPEHQKRIISHQAADIEETVLPQTSSFAPVQSKQEMLKLDAPSLLEKFSAVEILDVFDFVSKSIIIEDKETEEKIRKLRSLIRSKKLADMLNTLKQEQLAALIRDCVPENRKYFISNFLQKYAPEPLAPLFLQAIGPVSLLQNHSHPVGHAYNAVERPHFSSSVPAYTSPNTAATPLAHYDSNNETYAYMPPYSQYNYY